MQTKYKLPKDIYQATLWTIRGQRRRLAEYQRAKDDIFNGGGAKYIKTVNKITKQTEYVYLPKGRSNQSATELKAMALAALNEKAETQKMYIVQQAFAEVSKPFDEPERICAALIKNIENRHEYPYRRLGILPLSEKEFYALKSKLIYLVAVKLKLI